MPVCICLHWHLEECGQVQTEGVESRSLFAASFSFQVITVLQAGKLYDRPSVLAAALGKNNQMPKYVAAIQRAMFIVNVKGKDKEMYIILKLLCNH